MSTKAVIRGGAELESAWSFFEESAFALKKGDSLPKLFENDSGRKALITSIERRVMLQSLRPGIDLYLPRSVQRNLFAAIRDKFLALDEEQFEGDFGLESFIKLLDLELEPF